MSKQQGELDLLSLRGRVCVVTGSGNNGIGWGLAVHAGSHLGMHVVLVDLHESVVRQATAQLEALLKDAHPDVRILGIACDVTDPEQLASCLSQVRAAFPDMPIGAVFANAGVSFNRTIMKSTLAEWQTTLNVNVLGVVNTLKTFVPVLQEQPEESVVCTTASVGGLVRGDGGGSAYQASKHAVVALTESLSFELARRYPQIRVHVLCPCIVSSSLDYNSQVNAAVAAGESLAEDVEQMPLRSRSDLPMTPERHAEQVFDHIADGHFYMITDNVRPYVDHDFPFDGLSIVKERYDNLFNLQLDNSDAMSPGLLGGPSSSILKGPLWQEMARRSRQESD